MEQPEVLRLADRLTMSDYYEFDAGLHCPRAADELRRLHAENERLRADAALVRAQALEEAAAVCDAKASIDHHARLYAEGWTQVETMAAATVAESAAEAIRALKASPDAEGK